MADIFLSYASTDRQYVAVLAQLLERTGLSVWWDREIIPGNTWESVLESALDQARCIVVVWTKASVLSEWVRIEAGLGRERGILAPVFLEQVPLPIAFRQIQTASLIGWDGSESYSGLTGLCAGINAILSGPARIERPTSITEERALDAALPRKLPVQQSTTLITMVRRSDSAGLKGLLEDDDEYGLSPQDVVSKAIEVTYPTDPSGKPLPADILIRVFSPSFYPQFQEKKIRVQPNRDSTVCSFLMKPMEVGELSLQIDLYQNDACVASRLLRLLGLPQATVVTGIPGYQIVSMPMMVNSTQAQFLGTAAMNPQWAQATQILQPPAPPQYTPPAPKYVPPSPPQYATPATAYIPPAPPYQPPVAQSAPMPRPSVPMPPPRSSGGSVWAKAAVAAALLVISVPALMYQFPGLLNRSPKAVETPPDTQASPPDTQAAQPEPAPVPTSAAPLPEPLPRPAPVSPPKPPPPVPSSVPVTSADPPATVDQRFQTLLARSNRAWAALSLLEQQTQRQGLAMSADIVEADAKLTHELGMARQALDKGDSSSAEEHIGEAQKQVLLLERFLAR